MNVLRITALTLFAGATFPLSAAPGPMELFSITAASYVETLPTQTSNDAYPIGNGKLAAMIYGGVTQDVIQFNEDTVWAGQVHDYSHTNAVNFLAAIRNYVWAGQGSNAYNAANGAKNNFMSIPLRQSPYVLTGNLRLNFTHPSPTNYRRSLDLETALAKVQYTSGGVNYTREYFASYPDKVIVARITASQANALSFNYTFDSQHTAKTVTTSGTDLIMDGKVNKDANTARQQVSDVQFRARVKITVEGGTVTASSNTITVSGATSVTLIMSVATNFVKYNDLSGDRVARTDAILSVAGAKSYTALRDAHLADYQPLFQRVTLDLNSTNKSTLATSARLAAATTETALTADLQLIALNFQMARYLYIAGSRPGSQPLTLQGKWNNELDPAWESKMTVNINQEMNYWGVEVMNLPECDLPMVELCRDLSETGGVVAQKHYGSTGWVVHHNTDLWRGAAPINGADGIWTTGGAWLCQHLWWHYLYTGDKTYLAQVYPLMKGAAQFFVDTLVVDQRSGRTPYLMTNPGFSPEWAQPVLDQTGNGTTVAGVTMDNQLIRGLFDYVIQASEILGIDDSFRNLITSKRDLLPPNKIGSQGQIQEWLEDVDQTNQHRHMSPLVGLFPLDQISPIYEPALAAACKVHLDWKGDPTNNTSWSQAHKMCLRNTLFDGNRGFTILTALIRNSANTSFSDNLTFSKKGGGAAENQIDGNFGAAMGISMFFLQNTRGEIQILPALPTNIPVGSVTGLRSPGAFTVGITWAAGKLTNASIHSDLGNACRLRVSKPIYVTKSGVVVPVRKLATNLYEFSTTAGGDYEILPDTDDDGLADTFETNTGTFVSPTSTGTSPTLADTDGDTLKDGAEVALIGMGLNPFQNSSAWLTLLTQNGPPLGIYTRNQLLQVETGSQLLQRPAGNSNFVAKVNIAKTEKLDTWSNVNLQSGATMTRNGGTFHFSFVSLLAHEFYRFKVRDPIVPPGPPLTPVDPTDTDGDGIPDVTETALSSMGFAVGTDSSPLQQKLLANAAGLGLFTEASVRAIAFEGPERFEKTTGSTVKFDLNVLVENSAGTAVPAAFQPSDVLISGEDLQLTIPSDTSVEFYRITPSL